MRDVWMCKICARLLVTFKKRDKRDIGICGWCKKRLQKNDSS